MSLKSQHVKLSPSCSNHMATIRHIGLVARHTESLVRFYTRVFNLKVSDRRIETGSFIEKLVGIPDAQLEWAKLADANGIILEILHYRSQDDFGTTARDTTKPGAFHVAFTVEDAALVHHIVEQAGGGAGPLQTNPEGTVLVFYATDPEGNQIEIVQSLI